MLSQLDGVYDSGLLTDLLFRESDSNDEFSQWNMAHLLIPYHHVKGIIPTVLGILGLLSLLIAPIMEQLVWSLHGDFLGTTILLTSSGFGMKTDYS